MRTLGRAAAVLLIVICPVLAGSAGAHPGIGIVMDRQGTVFYTDLTHVWKIMPDGAKSIAVRNVHTRRALPHSAGHAAWRAPVVSRTTAGSITRGN